MAIHQLCVLILKLAYREFEERVGEIKAPRGAKRATGSHWNQPPDRLSDAGLQHPRM